MQPPYGLENGLYQPLSIPPPNFYNISYPAYPQAPFQPAYQQPTYVAPAPAPVPVKYEQVTVNGCVFFTPVYDVVEPDVGSLSVCSMSTGSIDGVEVPKDTEKKADQEGEKGQEQTQKKQNEMHKRTKKVFRKKNKGNKKNSMKKQK